MSEIKIGPAGSAGLSAEKGICRIRELALDCMEVEFTYGVRMKQPRAEEIGKVAKKQNISLSIHAPYYVNLASKESSKIGASRHRILKSCEMAHYMGAKYVVFHAAFYQQRDPELIYQMVKKEVMTLQEELKKNGWDATLAPETTGKASQFGNLDELLRLKEETGCHLCVDFAHLKARNVGEINYSEVMKKLQGKGHIHAHFSGIEWTAKGEKKHLLTADNDIHELLSYLVEYKIDANIINESPDPLGDAVKMKKILSDILSTK